MLLGIAASFIKIPAAHYLMGGIKTDLNGLSSLKGLYCCGEAACTGAHGANRLASNSILEALVFAKRICDHLKDNDDKIIKAADNKELKKADLAAAELAELKSELKEMMAGLAGIRRKNQIFLN